VLEFFDSSALAKRYLPETGSVAVRRATRDASTAVARIAFAEIAAATARAAREGAIDITERDRALTALVVDLRRWTVVELRPRVVSRVRELVTRHPLRGYDAIQLSSAIELRGVGRTVRFWCTDNALAAAAVGEGFTVVRPA
jgi:predicted nucleic acid-binding protein